MHIVWDPMRIFHIVFSSSKLVFHSSSLKENHLFATNRWKHSTDGILSTTHSKKEVEHKRKPLPTHIVCYFWHLRRWVYPFTVFNCFKIEFSLAYYYFTLSHWHLVVKNLLNKRKRQLFSWNKREREREKKENQHWIHNHFRTIIAFRYSESDWLHCIMFSDMQTTFLKIRKYRTKANEMRLAF